MAEDDVDFRHISLVLVPTEAERLEEVLAEALSMITAEQTWVARYPDYRRLHDALQTIGHAYDVSNMAVALQVLLDLFDAHRDDFTRTWVRPPSEADDTDWVPLSTAFATDRVPAPAARVIRQAVTQMVDRGEVSEKAPWQAAEFWAASYLAGA